MHRTVAVISNKHFSEPFMIDIMKVTSQHKHEYDLPFYYFGQIIQTNSDYKRPLVQQAMGDNNGYQHLFLEASAQAERGTSQFSWLNKGKFFTLSTLTNNTDELILTRIGANDPDFNLRNDPGFLLRRKNTKNTTFVSLIEPHGSYSPITELSLNSNSSIKALKLVFDSERYTAVQILDVDNNKQLLLVANSDNDEASEHSLTLGDSIYTWTGPYHYVQEG